MNLQNEFTAKDREIIQAVRDIKFGTVLLISLSNTPKAMWSLAETLSPKKKR